MLFLVLSQLFVVHKRNYDFATLIQNKQKEMTIQMVKPATLWEQESV